MKRGVEKGGEEEGEGERRKITGVGGHPGVFSIFLDRAPGFFLRIFTGNFLDFSENTLPPCRNMFSVFPFRGFFLAFFGFSKLLPSLSRGHFEKNGQVLG